ncbi:MAG: EpsI family protein [Proteobacteria bacterium]|nr:EpsI family protein [Pseudomonadota bacterium]
MSKVAVALTFVALNYYVYQFWATEEVIPDRALFAEFPLQLGDWTCTERQTMKRNQLKILGATDYLLCNFGRESDSSLINVYVGYHSSQVRKEGGGGNETVIHPPEHCLPGSGWNIIDSNVVQVDHPGLPEGMGVLGSRREAKRFVIAKGKARQLVYFWYQSQGRVFARNNQVILSRMWDRARRGRTDGSLVRFTVPIQRGDVEAAEERYRSLAEQLVPLLPRYIPE